ncbi:proteasome assembly chaperone family protein [Arthrobacter sp. UM1]|uniref:proteasome assembly chaperone family protein n=1 Tax=Arthrobacter sp. UM1 TaxID=2766776 RepID=UPI001CF6508D|nr:PAC2 family protein [Arthrobacter sp. UM1]MCB4207502.1 PAC2 family protein [Arthrobacter sp. UM1]
MTEHGDPDDQQTLLDALDAMSAVQGGESESPRTVLVLAFKGWNDAGESASGVLRRIRRLTEASSFESLSDERYYDYQVLRPRVRRQTDGRRTVAWPGVRFYEAGETGERLRLIVAYGHEPSFLWKSYAERIMGIVARERVDAVVLLGAMLADTPHTRPLPTSTTSESEPLRRILGIEQSVYEGPTGMLGILSEKFSRSGLPAVSVWVSVPHYVSQAPSPKAELALLSALEELFGRVWPDGTLAQDAEEWEGTVNELAEADSDISEYVHKLEQAVDSAVDATAALPQASGEAIAKEFEQYLRAYNDDDAGGRADDDSDDESDSGGTGDAAPGQPG